MCSACHPSRPGPGGEPPVFTDFTYDNLGVPKNPLNPFYGMTDFNPAGADWVDFGLGDFLRSAGYPPEVFETELGKQKVPTLRNVDLRPYEGFAKAYAHNGVFKSLEEIVHFYNTRDVVPWPPPEVPVNVNSDELGNLGLTADEEAAVVAFLKTLSDGFVPAGAPRAAGGVAAALTGEVAFSLRPNAPNPFRDGTWMPFALPKAERVWVRIHDARGRLVRALDLGVLGGSLDRDARAYWDGRDDRGERVGAGIYYYVLEAGTLRGTGRMVKLD
jgi:hypothetical protein